MFFFTPLLFSLVVLHGFASSSSSSLSSPLPCWPQTRHTHVLTHIHARALGRATHRDALEVKRRRRGAQQTTTGQHRPKQPSKNRKRKAPSVREGTERANRHSEDPKRGRASALLRGCTAPLYSKLPVFFLSSSSLPVFLILAVDLWPSFAKRFSLSLVFSCLQSLFPLPSTSSRSLPPLPPFTRRRRSPATLFVCLSLSPCAPLLVRVSRLR